MLMCYFQPGCSLPRRLWPSKAYFRRACSALLSETVIFYAYISCSGYHGLHLDSRVSYFFIPSYFQATVSINRNSSVPTGSHVLYVEKRSQDITFPRRLISSTGVCPTTWRIFDSLYIISEPYCGLNHKGDASSHISFILRQLMYITDIKKKRLWALRYSSSGSNLSSTK